MKEVSYAFAAGTVAYFALRLRACFGRARAWRGTADMAFRHPSSVRDVSFRDSLHGVVFRNGSCHLSTRMFDPGLRLLFQGSAL